MKQLNHTWRTFPVIHVIFGVKTSWDEGGSSRGGRPLRLCFGGGGSSASPSLRTVSTPGVAAPGLWPLFPRSFCVESLRQLTSAKPLMCKSSAVFNRDDNLVWNIQRTTTTTLINPANKTKTRRISSFHGSLCPLTPSRIAKSSPSSSFSGEIFLLLLLLRILFI